MKMIWEFYNKLFRHYGEQHWWPSRTGSRWEIITGAVLTQNCAWINVEKALANLMSAALDTPEAILYAEGNNLKTAIRPTGFFHQKAVYLRELATFFLEHETEFLTSNDIPMLREKLLCVKGVGRETADSILLYAFQKPIFVIDAYTRRVAERHLALDKSMPYDTLQKHFTDALPAGKTQLYNEYHALIVRFCKESCRKATCGDFCRDINFKT